MIEIWPILKSLGIVAFVLWVLNIFRENGRIKEKAKHVENQNKKLIHQSEYQVLEFKRAEKQAKKAHDFSIALEKKLLEIDPTSLSDIELDRMSSDPLGFTEISTSPEQPSLPSKDEND